jgi:hypothetical protein
MEAARRLLSLVKGLHLFSAFGAEDGGQIVVVHDCLLRQVDEKKAAFMIATGLVVTVESMMAGVLLGIRRQLFHGFAAPRAEDRRQVVAIHHHFRCQLENERAFVRMGAAFVVTIKAG